MKNMIWTISIEHQCTYRQAVPDRADLAWWAWQHLYAWTLNTATTGGSERRKINDEAQKFYDDDNNKALWQQTKF